MAASKFDLESSQNIWTKSGVFARVSTHLHVQRDKCSNLSNLKGKNVNKVYKFDHYYRHIRTNKHWLDIQVKKLR